MRRGLKGILILFFAAWAWAEGNGTLVCTFRGSGKDAVYTIHCRMGKTVLFEAPADIERYVIGDPANWLAACKGNLMWLQAQQGGSRTSLFIICHEDRPEEARSLFCFELVESSHEPVKNLFEKIVILTGAGFPENGMNE